jgi:anti-anti-sigma factor
VEDEGGIRWGLADIPVAHLSGEFDLANSAHTFTAIGEHVHGYPVVIDLTDVTFIDSYFIDAMVRFTGDHPVRVVATRHSLPYRVLKTTGMGDLVAIYETIAQAVDDDRSR